MLRVPTLLYLATLALVVVVNAVCVGLYVLSAERAPAGPGEGVAAADPSAPPTLLEAVRQQVEEDAQTGNTGVRLYAVELDNGRLHLEGAVPRAELKSGVERVARAVAHERNCEIRECRNDLRDPLDLVREALPATTPRTVALTDIRLGGGVLTIEGLVAESSQKAVVERAARARVEEALGPGVIGCDTSGLHDLREAVQAAVAPQHKGVRLTAVRIVERTQAGKKLRVVALSGTVPSRAAAYAAAEAAQKLLNAHGFAVEDWDRHDLKVEAGQSKSQ
jgi:hypothetical protein